MSLMVTTNTSQPDIGTMVTSLKKREDGIWYSSDTIETSYPPDGHDVCFMLEDTSYWFRHRNECIVAAVKNFPPENNGIIFDIGGGNGYVSMGLEKAGFNAALLEPGKQGAFHARSRGLKNIVCATLESSGFRPHSIPAAGLFDVIEHIEQDGAFLQAVSTLLIPKGLLYITVPAFSFLWSQEDQNAGHYKRYDLESISQLLQSSGFNVLFATYFFRFLTLPIFLSRSLPYKLNLLQKNSTTDHSRDHATGSTILADIISRVLHPEIANITNRKTMSFGSSCLVVAQAH